jgi:hypothetical protein
VPTFIWKVVEQLLMIDGQSSPGSMVRWRVLVAILLLGFGMHILWACGMFKPFGIDGFVTAADLRSITAKLDTAASTSSEVQDRLLKKSILDTRILQCNAASKRYFTDRLNEQLDEYYAVNKRGFNLPTCQELN